MTEYEILEIFFLKFPLSNSVKVSLIAKKYRKDFMQIEYFR